MQLSVVVNRFLNDAPFNLLLKMNEQMRHLLLVANYLLLSFYNERHSDLRALLNFVVHVTKTSKLLNSLHCVLENSM